jgi:hypothetical protein
MAVWSKAYVCGWLTVRNPGSNPVEGMDVCLLFVVCFVCSYLCKELITRSENSYLVCDLETSTTWLRPDFACCTTEKKKFISKVMVAPSCNKIIKYALRIFYGRPKNVGENYNGNK